VERAALPGRLTWQVATVTDAITETDSARTLVLDVAGWNGHIPGQHVDVRLTAPDGYQAHRSYSIASAPGEPLQITVERIVDGEVSPFLVDELEAGTQFDVRGPVGRYFVWEPNGPTDVFLVAGGSGVVPLRSILRHRVASGDGTRMRLLYSARHWDDVIYRDELETLSDGVEVVWTLTRSTPPGWSGYQRRVDSVMLSESAWPAATSPRAYVCGPTGFVESVAGSLRLLGYDGTAIRTERFGGA
jgi:ferredoxin-NADP reductase